MDYCKEFPALVDHCYIYRHDGTDWLKTSDFGDLDKLNVLFSLYLPRSDEMVETVLKLYVRLAEHGRDAVFHLPELPKDRQSGVLGKSGSVRVDFGVLRIIKK